MVVKSARKMKNVRATEPAEISLTEAYTGSMS